ncbi:MULTISPECIES: dTDP-4-dehydrorhamnose 3,5-epimerase [unclassified Candidatus Frackibacter]|uniref:dTDP-4-dehydrorhamnose 3,5-epimerase n=1 Tax=unclassified Candidatus Frackibacter TaxID=2648818 RepID=UPI00088E8BDA|nr:MULTISPECIES: dTDP-4-dehydrorhamnose 3,5-epimerase [unclassified Candidatus Frackibacter]SDC07804.1 dTDP-4-dehydrorhamnose 3,5-epimerase [Candidatus Frackibacter sp. WG11]SEM38653.1 dTDP-4-dehydrorhamnose 3,5-epimerase [Candidatus Frackibacter sp. WG12]SFL44333.1 dTDP-4-dehydrorhamnose 3,5-epimerase [Candidatus Frackibacter sp. WG13]
MELIKTKLQGVYIIQNPVFSDNRGVFSKIYHEDIFEKNGLCTDFKESYYSVSKKNVIRGMHFQLPPYDHEKLVYVPKGEVLDVVLDLRTNSDTFGDYIAIELSATNKKSIYIPKGLAHGFKSLKDNTITVYNVSTVYSSDYDTGISWNSFGMDWGLEEPIVSKRDQEFISLDKFDSPF